MKFSFVLLVFFGSLHINAQSSLVIEADEYAGVTRLMYPFIEALEDHNFHDAMDYFDTAHSNPQMKMYYTDDFMFGHLGEEGERHPVEIVRLYLMESMQLRLKNPESMEAIVKVKKVWIKVEDDLPTMKMLIKIKGEGKVMATVYFDPKTFKFSGPFG